MERDAETRAKYYIELGKSCRRAGRRREGTEENRDATGRPTESTNLGPLWASRNWTTNQSEGRLDLIPMHLCSIHAACSLYRFPKDWSRTVPGLLACLSMDPIPLTEPPCLALIGEDTPNPTATWWKGSWGENGGEDLFVGVLGGGELILGYKVQNWLKQWL